MKPNFLTSAPLVGLMLSFGQPSASNRPTNSMRTEQITLASISNAQPGKTQNFLPETTIDPKLICRVQHTIRWLDRPWTDEQCLARAMNFTEEADRWNLNSTKLFSMAINESDLRTNICRKSGNGLDCGILGVRCVTGSDGRCKNKPVKGLLPAQLLQPSRNIAAGAWILATLHRGDLASYNGGPHTRDRNSYPRKISAIMSALGGVDVLAKCKRHRKETRMEKLTRTIAQAIKQ